MPKLILIAICLTLCGAQSCKKNDVENVDYLTFGHFYGECGGEQCVEIFKLTENSLSEDIKDNYPNFPNKNETNFSTQLSNDKYENSKNLWDFFPNDLWLESNRVLGQPDAGDWGGIYIECKKGELEGYWLLDQMESNMDEKYQEFVKKVNEKIAFINK